MELSEAFRDQSKNLNIALQSALEKLKNNPSDPAALAEYQSALSQYTLYRNAQSSVVKAYKDVGAGIIANYR
ncbi:EscF/YscF/HrpA family type III secretion system needle major subunit [Glaciimonas sp. PCH181]|nr:EscF/YscF/HrpA family type III secretion system needle major subunit [Glaciimonas sp. PCH181]